MANADKPRGLTPVRHLNGSPYNGATERMYIATGAGDLFVGDPVIHSGSADTDGVPGIDQGLASGIYVGVITSFVADKTDLTNLYSKAAGYANVCTAPDVIYSVQDDGDTAMTAGTVGLNVAMIAGAGDSTTGRSGYEIDSGGTTTPATTAGIPLRLLGLVQRADNTLAANADWEVMITDHRYRTTTGV